MRNKFNIFKKLRIKHKLSIISSLNEELLYKEPDSTEAFSYSTEEGGIKSGLQF